MVTSTSKRGPVFYTFLSIFYEDKNKECPLTMYEQFSKCNFEEITSQHLKIYGIKEVSKQRRKAGNKQANSN